MCISINCLFKNISNTWEEEEEEKEKEEEEKKEKKDNDNVFDKNRN